MKRPFRGLRRQAPRRRYDAVVVGAGIGGLICANLLVRKGLSVLLVEQHYMVGGYCSTFRRAGYTFDAASHFYPLLGNPETITGRLLVDLGVRTEWVKMDPVDTFHFPDGSRFVVDADLETYRKKLNAMFPHERAALDTFFEDVREAYLLGLLAYFRERATARLKPLQHLTLGDELQRRFRDPKLRLLLTADCPHWGSTPGNTSFVFDSMLRLSYFLGNYYPVGGSQAFADDLARCFEEQGGEILMSTQVDRILVDQGRAVGIEGETLRGSLRGPQRVAADVVVANGDLLHTWEHLLGPAHVEPSALLTLRQMKPSYPCFLTHIGLQGADAAALEEAQGYYWSSLDTEQVGTDSLVCKIFVPTVYEPRMAPAGGQIVILQKVQRMDYDQIVDWPSHKAAVEDFVLDHLKRTLPGIERHIRVVTSASAQTSHRFTLNRSGAMLGWEMSPQQLGEGRPSVQGPVEGLYQVGHWTRPGGGITPVIISAMRAAEVISRPASRSTVAERSREADDLSAFCDTELSEQGVALSSSSLLTGC